MTDTNEIRVFANIGDDPITFETVQDFNLHYNRNKKLIDSFSTRGLNRKFIIPGYKIGRKKGEIILYPIQQQQQTDATVERDVDDLGMIEEKIDSMNERLKKIEQLLAMLFNNAPATPSYQQSRQFYKN